MSTLQQIAETIRDFFGLILYVAIVAMMYWVSMDMVESALNSLGL